MRAFLRAAQKAGFVIDGAWEELHVNGRTREWGWDLDEDGNEPETEVEKEAERNKWCVIGRMKFK